MSGGWRESSFVVVSLADLRQVPEFKAAICDLTKDEETRISVSEEKAKWLSNQGQKVEVVDAPQESDLSHKNYFWIRKGIPLKIIRQFMIDNLDASPSKHFEFEFCIHRTVQNKVVTTERYCMLHKKSKFVDHELYTELNEMQKTSTWGK